MYQIPNPNLVSEVETDADPVCGLVDPLTTAVCSMKEGHVLPHRDKRDNDFWLEFPDPPPTLLIP